MLAFTTEQIGGLVGGFFWPFVRISALMMAAPVFGAQLMPVRIRILMAFAISLVAVPLLPPVPFIDPISYPGLLILLQQVLIGVAMGFVFHMVFQALIIAGEAIASTMGLGFARMVDPANGVQVPVISQYLIVMATLLFVILNGHLMLIELVVESFRFLPVGDTGLSAQGYWKIASWGSQMFIGALLVAIPAVSALLVVNISMGIITRAAPQLNIFAVGFPMMILLGFIFLTATTPSMLTQFTHLLLDSFEAVKDIVETR
ncbi:MAG: flagellar biosynthetic protein FliR [Gammaproteobacteria bacterium]|nr:flagellar biosynthetic protein FliR [Gammaproteobacteria bacterium]